MVFQLQFERVLFGTTGCKAFGMLFNIYLVGTPLFMVLNAVERFIAVVYPLKLTQLITRTRLRIGAVTIWVTLLLFGTGFVLGSDLHTSKEMGAEWCIIKMIGLSTVQSGLPICIVFVIIPILCLSILYGATSWTLIRSIATFKSTATVGQGSETTRSRGSGRYQSSNDNTRKHQRVVFKSASENNERYPPLKLNGMEKNGGGSDAIEIIASEKAERLAPLSRGDPNRNREAIRKYTNGRYRATCLLVLTVMSHTALCIPFIINQVLSFTKVGFYPGTPAEENLTLFCTPILVTSSAVVPILYLAISNYHRPIPGKTEGQRITFKSNNSRPQSYRSAHTAQSKHSVTSKVSYSRNI